MTIPHASNTRRLIASRIGETQTTRLIGTLAIDPAFGVERALVSRAEMAMALNATLFADLIRRVPTGAAYVDQAVAMGGHILFDHGALRTVRFAEGGTGALPPGADAFARILAPLGYVHARAYPLPALGMTGHAWCHADLAEAIPQFFVSELHVERFSPVFQDAARRVFGTTRDPLDAAALAALDMFAAHGEVPFAVAAAALPALTAAFDRHHDLCALDDYRTLLAESAEGAWIATEGNAFNHATDRVPDVDGLAAQLRTRGYPVKDKVEHSATGRVRQTAFRADAVERRFTDGDRVTTLNVPGSFYEFITRDIDPATGTLDLSFDSSNAQGIFAMTKAA